MDERCPLGGGIYWNNRNDIPDLCLTSCQPVWLDATRKISEIDFISETCDHFVEFEDESLQRASGSSRIYGILYICMEQCGEAFAESWQFKCLND